MFRTIGIISLLALAAPALADGLSYNYLQAGYQEIDIDDSVLDVDGDGFNVGGSFEVGDSMHIFAGYTAADFDFGVDLDQLEVGFGFHSALSPNVDLVANLAYVSIEASALGLSIDDDGFGASVGIRAMVSESFELEGSVNYIDLDSGGDDTSIAAAGWYNLSETFALGVEVDFGDDVTSYGVGARLYFGQ